MTARRYYKATRPDGTDFYTGTVDYGAALATGDPVTHPAFGRHGDASSYLSVATVPTDCTGSRWPCRLFAVEAVGRAWRVRADLPNKRALRAVRVVEELPARQVFGPQGEVVVALIDRASRLTADEVDRLYAAWAGARDAAGYAAWYAAWAGARDAAWAGARDAARDAAGYAARDAAGYAASDAARDAARDAASDAARDAARDAAGYAAGYAARDAAWALVARDLITPEHYTTLTAPWAAVIGPAHPEDVTR